MFIRQTSSRHLRYIYIDAFDMKLLAFANLSTLILTTAAVSNPQPLNLGERILSVQIDQVIHSECTDKTKPDAVPGRSSEV